MKSPFLYPGSKGKPTDIKQIKSCLPDFDYWIEPFVGGGSVILNQKPPHIPAIISDVNCDLIKCWTAMRDSPTELIACLPRINCKTDPQYYDLWTTVKNKECVSDAEYGAKYLFINRTSFQGFGGRLDKFSQRYNFSTVEKRIWCCSAVLTNVQIECSGALEQISRHDRDGGFIFLDPPYLGANNTACYKRDLWTKKDFISLAELLKTVKSKWLMTIDDSDEMRGYFAGNYMKCFEWESMRANKGKQHGVELYVANYPI